MNDEKLQQEKTQDYLDLIFPEADTTSLQKKKAVKIPSINKNKKKEESASPTPSVSTPPIESKPEEKKEEKKLTDEPDNLDVLRGEINKAIEDAHLSDGIQRELQNLKDTVQDLERDEKLEVLKEEIRQDVLKQIEPLQKELQDLKDRKVPERRQFETDGAYKEQLYPIATSILDKIIIPLINIVPDYNLISTQILKTYEDGTIQNGIVSINMIVPNNDYRYDFRVDLKVLNGLIEVPSSVMRGRNLIPLTAKDLYNEINTYSYRKLDPNYSYRKSPFSNRDDNIHRREDKQKFYEVKNQTPPSSTVSEDHKWKAFKQRGLI